MSNNTSEERLRTMESFKRLINLGLSAVCLFLEIGIFGLNWLYHFQYSVVEELQDFYFKGHMLEIAIYGIILFMFSTMYGGMRMGYLKNAEIIFSQIFATIMANILIYAELSVMAFQLFVPDVFILMTMEQTVVVVVYISIANKLYRSWFPPRKLLLIHGDRPVQEISNKFESRRDKYSIIAHMHIEKGVHKICSEIARGYEKGEYNAVVIGDISVEERNQILKFCYGRAIRVYLMPKISDVIMMGAEELHVFDTPLLLTREYSLTMEQRFIKRAIDIVCSKPAFGDYLSNYACNSDCHQDV